MAPDDRPDHAGAGITVQVAYSPRAGVVEEVTLVVPAATDLFGALRLSGLLQRYPGIDTSTRMFGIWGQLRPLDAALRDGDRVEVYRPLLIDPKDARRLRQRRQQATTCNPRR